MSAHRRAVAGQVVIVAALLSAVAAPASGQPRSNCRAGVLAVVGAGPGTFLCSDCESSFGGGAFIGIGGTLGERATLTGEAHLWGRFSGTDAAGTFLGAVLRFYPRPESGIHVMAGIGIEGLASAGGAGVVPAYPLGLGIDTRLARGVSLTPFVRVILAGSEATWASAGIALTLH